jgi:hypothetical protein
MELIEPSRLNAAFVLAPFPRRDLLRIVRQKIPQVSSEIPVVNRLPAIGGHPGAFTDSEELAAKRLSEQPRLLACVKDVPDVPQQIAARATVSSVRLPLREIPQRRFSAPFRPVAFGEAGDLEQDVPAVLDAVE